MKSYLYHTKICVTSPAKSIPFYKDFFAYLGYRVIDESKNHLGVSNGKDDFWIVPISKTGERKFKEGSVGLHHLAFMVNGKKEVDKFYIDFLLSRKIKTLYKSPRLFPQYTKDYYAVFFKDPDGMKIEVVYRKR